MKRMITTLLCMSLIGFCACKKELVEYRAGDIEVRIEAGSEYLHDFALMLGIKKKNAPQIAVWIEDTQGRYLQTIYVTHKIATQRWTAAGGNRRQEALPHWCHQRGVLYDDGLYLPTKKEPLADAISGATPRNGFDVRLRPEQALQQFVVKVEVNHSTDFNDAYPKSAEPGDAGYSGGKMGSGQPALVYAAAIDLTAGNRSFEARLVGHSSPDGSDGAVDPDTSSLTTALDIVKRITVNLR